MMRASNKFIRIDDLIDLARFHGAAYDASAFVENLTSGSPLRTIMVNTGTKPVILYSRTVNYTGDGVVARIHRDPVVSVLGDPADLVRNPNDINPDTSVIKFYSNATITSDGQETRAPDYSFGNQTGSGGGAPGQVLPTPQIMKPGQTYLLEIAGMTANAQDVAVKLSWVELDGIPGFEFDESGNFISYRGISLK